MVDWECWDTLRGERLVLGIFRDDRWLTRSTCEGTFDKEFFFSKLLVLFGAAAELISSVILARTGDVSFNRCGCLESLLVDRA